VRLEAGAVDKSTKRFSAVSLTPAAEPIRQDRSLPVRIQIGQRVRERLSYDSPTIRSDAELAERQARALKCEQLFLCAVESDLLFVPLSPAPLPRDL